MWFSFYKKGGSRKMAKNIARFTKKLQAVTKKLKFKVTWRREPDEK